MASNMKKMRHLGSSMQDYAFDPYWLTVDNVKRLREELPTWKAVFLSKSHEKFEQFKQSDFVKTLEGPEWG